MSNETKQTAVEYYAKQLQILADDVFKIGLTLDEFRIKKHELLEQAKEMEKEQHGVTFHVGVQWIQYQMDSIHGCLEYWDKEPPEFEIFYNETYGGNK
jgi:hypothetical protein